jgi:hypothetical protein
MLGLLIVGFAGAIGYVRACISVTGQANEEPDKQR